VNDYSNIQAQDIGTPTEPVTLAEQKAWSKIDFTDEDTLITQMIKAARQAIEHFTNRALVPKTISFSVQTPEQSEFTSVVQLYKVKLPYLKGAVIDEDTLVVTDFDEVELAAETDYYNRGNLLMYVNGYYNVTYDVTPTVPQALKEAIMTEVDERYKRGTNSGLSQAAQDKAAPFVDIWL
jgi:hypothetical protein